MAKLYPPVIEGTIPAFSGTSPVVVPLSMNRSVSDSDIGGFALQVKTIQSNTYVTTVQGVWATTEHNSAEFSTADWTVPGQSYKLQLAYINKEKETGYFSTVGIVKCSSLNSACLHLVAQGSDVDLTKNYNSVTPFKYTYSGSLDYTNDPMEKVYNYQFRIFNEAKEVVYDSGILLHNANNDTNNTSVDTYTFLDDLDDNEIFELQYTVTTVNGLTLSTPKIMIMMSQELISDTDIALTAQNMYDNGYVQLKLSGSVDEATGVENYVSGTFKIYRQDTSLPKRWEPIFSFILQNEQPSSYSQLKDFTVEHNKTYKYKLCQFNSNNILATVAQSNEVYVDFEDMFLFDGQRQLKIQYNPKVSSFKNDILESKLDTIGSKYPFFFRNGHVHYKEFPISGLISYWMDDEELFKPLNEIGLEKDNYIRNYTPTIPMYQVKDIREQVRHWVSEVNPITGEPTGHWGIWYDNGSIWTNAGYPHSDVSTPLDEKKEFRTIDTGKWIATNETWIRANNIPASSYRKNLQYDASQIGIKTPEWDNGTWGKSAEYAYTKHYKTTDLVNYNIAAERQFKLDVLEWLTNGKPKLFRSPAEGNYIVRLMNTSLTPNDTLGRMLHTFSSTAYEIDDCDYGTLGSYGFINGETIINNTKKLRFRTVALQDIYKAVKNNSNSPYKMTNGSIEILINPSAGYGTVVAQSLKIEDCEYGDKFKINNDLDIVIGATQSYNIDGPFEIISLQCNWDNIGATAMWEENPSTPYGPLISYSYYDTFSSAALFDNISDIMVSSVPAKQFIQTGNVVSNNLVNEIENIKTKVTKYDYLMFEKRPVEEIYTAVDLSVYYSAWFNGNGFSRENFNGLFSFDKYAWNREARLMSLNDSRLTPWEIVTSMPFTVFKIMPAKVFSDETAKQLREQYRIIRAAINRLHASITKNDLATKTADEIIALFGANQLTNEEKIAIRAFKALQEQAIAVISGTVNTQRQDYFETEDVGETKPNKTYYKKISSITDGDEIYNTYIVYSGEIPIKPGIEGYNAETYFPVYEYGDIWVAENDELKDLYLNFEYDAWPNNAEYYFAYDGNNFKLFDGGNYSTKVYVNTGHLTNLNLNDPTLASKSIDLKNAVQPVLYKNIENITDIYIGNGVFATLGYQYSTTSYAVEQNDEVIAKRTAYYEILNEYKEAVQNYTTGPDPIDNYYDQINTAYNDYIDLLNRRVEEWRRETEANG